MDPYSEEAYREIQAMGLQAARLAAEAEEQGNWSGASKFWSAAVFCREALKRRQRDDRYWSPPRDKNVR